VTTSLEAESIVLSFFQAVTRDMILLGVENMESVEKTVRKGLGGIRRRNSYMIGGTCKWVLA
jgi:hypothetical protein